MSARDVPPHSLDAERAVLGAVLVDNDALLAAERFVRPEDFYRAAHTTIYRQMLTLAADGRAIDPITLAEHLGDQALESVGGRVYLASLVDGVPRSSHIEQYARIVKDHARARSVIMICRRAIHTISTDPAVLRNGIGQRLADAVRLEVDAAHAAAGPQGLSPADLEDAAIVAAEGQAIAATGIRYLVDGLIPNYGVAGMDVAFTKVGKTTFSLAAGAAVARGETFLDRAVQQARVLAVMAEDPREYTAYLARHLAVPPDTMTFYRRSVRFDAPTLAAIVQTVKAGQYGLVLVSSWQAVVAGLMKDENDNAGAVAIVERVKQAARETGVPWLIDAHSGKGEDQSDEADPTRALRGASAAAGAADFLLSLRYADGPFSARRRLSGKGRFVALEPMLIDFDAATGRYSTLGDTKSATREHLWARICEVGILRDWCSTDAIAMAIGAVSASGRVTGHARRSIRDALRGRGLDTRTETRRGRQTTLYRLADEDGR
jgi:hypothetical protein